MAIQIGITGLIGAGKTTVSRMAFEAGFPVIDADAEVHKLYASDEVLRAAVAREFGREALTPMGVDRAYLAARVFTNTKELEKLESLVHPTLFRSLVDKSRQWTESTSTVPPAIFLDAALLYKWPFFVEQLTQVWVVEAPEEVRVTRLVGRGLTEQDARNRIAMQRHFPALSGENVIRIVNDDDMDAFRNKVKRLLGDLRACFF